MNVTAASPSDIQRLRSIGDVGCSRGRGVVGALWLEHRTEITLPTPTGSFAVGRAIYDWTDDATGHAGAGSGNEARAPCLDLVPVGGWAISGDGRLRARSDAAAAGPAGGLLRLLTRDLSKVHGHSTRDSDVSPQQRSYPVVIMRAGASAGVLNYSTLAEDLASHGYVVVGFDAPYRTWSSFSLTAG